MMYAACKICMMDDGCCMLYLYDGCCMYAACHVLYTTVYFDIKRSVYVHKHAELLIMNGKIEVFLRTYIFVVT